MAVTPRDGVLPPLGGPVRVGLLRRRFSKHTGEEHSPTRPPDSLPDSPLREPTVEQDAFLSPYMGQRNSYTELQIDTKSNGSPTRDDMVRRKLEASKSGWFNYGVLQNPAPALEGFRLPGKRLQAVKADEGEICPELAPILAANHPVYGLFSYVAPPELTELCSLCKAHPVALDFLSELSGRIEVLQPGTQLYCRVRRGTDTTVSPVLAPLVSVVTQLVAFYATYKTNTDLSFNRFARCFANGGLLGLGTAVLVALAVSEAAGNDGCGEDAFLDSAERACHLALLLGRAVATHHITLPPGSAGQSYTLQVHNISCAVLEVCLEHINNRPDAAADIEISFVLATRSFYLSGYPTDLVALQSLLRSLSGLGFKFGTRFLPFTGPIQSSLNAPAVALLAEDFEKLCFKRENLALDVISPVDGAQLRESDNLASSLVEILLLLPHCATEAHGALQFNASIISFETANVPNALGPHNLIVNHLLLVVPYMRCVSQPYTFTHTRPSLDDLHPRNNTKEGRRLTLLKCAMMNEVFAKLGSSNRADLLASWLELDMLERRAAPSPRGLKGQFTADVSVRTQSGPTCFVPSPTTQEIDPDLLRTLSGDIDELNHSSALYNVERIEALGQDLTEVSADGTEFLRLLGATAGQRFEHQSLWRCPNVISFVEHWLITERLQTFTPPPVTPCHLSKCRAGTSTFSDSCLMQGPPGVMKTPTGAHPAMYSGSSASSIVSAGPRLPSPPHPPLPASASPRRYVQPAERRMVPKPPVTPGSGSSVRSQPFSRGHGGSVTSSAFSSSDAVRPQSVPEPPDVARRRRQIHEKMSAFYTAVKEDQSAPLTAWQDLHRR